MAGRLKARVSLGRAGAGLVLALACCLCWGCAAGGGRVRLGPTSQPAIATSQPAADNVATVAPEAAQSGWVNTALQGLTGIQVQSNVSGRLLLLLAFHSYLSHRREMSRLRRGASTIGRRVNGKADRDEG